MLSDVANFINENPVIILVGFACSIIGTIEVIYSLIANLRTKKQKKEIDEKTKEIYEYLHGKADFDETSNKLEKAKKELEDVRKQLKIDLPRERERAILTEQIQCEEKIINETNIRIQRLKSKMEDKLEIDAGNKLFKRIQEFISSEKTKGLVILLLILETFSHFASIVVGENAARILGVISVIVIGFYAWNVFDALKSEDNKKIINHAINIAVCLSFIDTFGNGDASRIIWWAIFVLLLSLFRKTSSIFVDTIGQLLCIPIFISAFVFKDYTEELIVTTILIQCILLVLNVVRIIGIIKNR